jgi:hypothetical protein
MLSANNPGLQPTSSMRDFYLLDNRYGLSRPSTRYQFQGTFYPVAVLLIVGWHWWNGDFGIGDEIG